MHAVTVASLLGLAVIVFLYVVKRVARGGRCSTSYLKGIKGKVVVITGGNSGIGLETAKVLAANGARIVLGCRDEKRAEEAIDNIKEYCAEHGRKEGVEVSFIPLDLADQVSIHQFAREFDKLSLPLHVLINNAGIMHPPHGTTQQGIEIQFGVNHLGHFLLTNLLLEHINKCGGRVVTVSSKAHYLAFGPRPDEELQEGYINNGTLLNGATCASLHPGIIETELWRNYPFILGWLSRPVGYLIFKNAEEGAQTTLYCACVPTLKNGEYYSDCKAWEPKDMIREATDDDLASRLWEISERFTGLNAKRDDKTDG